MIVAAAQHEEDALAGGMASQETLWCGHTDGSVMSIDADGLHECRTCFEAHRTAVTALAVVACERELWTGSDSGTIRAWPDLGRHEEHSVELALPAEAGSTGSPEVKALIYLGSSQTVWSAANSGIHVWHARTHAYKTTLPGSARATCLTVVDAGVAGGPALAMSGHADGRVVLWSVSESGNGRLCRELFSAGWDASKGLVGSGHRVTALCAYSLPALPELSIPADTALWAGFSDGSMHTYLGSTGELLSVINAHNSAIVSLSHYVPVREAAGGSASSGSRVVSSSKKGTLRVWGGDGLMWRERRQLAWVRALRAHCMSESSHDVAVATWNVNAKDPTVDGTEGVANWLSWRNAGGSVPPALYAIGFQEVVPLNAAEMISVSTDQAVAWETVVGQALAASDGGQTYTCIRSQQLVGILLLLFVRDDLVGSISDISTSVVKTGIGGMGGNKGAAGVRLRLFETPVTFCCAHLAAHQDGHDDRDAHYHEIVQNMAFSQTGSTDLLLGRGQADRISSSALQAASADRSSPVIYNAAQHSHFGDVALLDASHPLVFWLGDLNYRIDLPRSETETLIRQIVGNDEGSRSAPMSAAARERAFAKERAMDQLRAHDQLFASRRRLSAFDEFEEPPLTFKPTYKFDPGTLDTYDTSEKQRIPAWCDRVLYRRADKGGATVRENGYTSVESLTCSDHKPVVASFTVKIQKYDNQAAATQLRQQFEAVPPRKTASAFPISAVATSPRPRMQENPHSRSSTIKGTVLAGTSPQGIQAASVQPAPYSYVKQQMASFGLQGVGAVQWGGKGDWKPTHVQLMGSTLRLRGTGFAADTGPDGVDIISLLGTETRRPTTVRKGHPHAFRVNLIGADRLKYGVTKILCDLNDKMALEQWIASLNDAANLDTGALAAAAATAASASSSGELNSSTRNTVNGGLDEEAAIRAAIAMSSAGNAAPAATHLHGGDEDEDAPALMRRRVVVQAGARPAHATPGLDTFGSTPFETPVPEPEPEPASGPVDLHEFFGTNSAGTATINTSAAPADLFGMSPFTATPSSDDSGGMHAPPGGGENVDLFGSVPFSGAPSRNAESAPVPNANDQPAQDLLQGW